MSSGTIDANGGIHDPGNGQFTGRTQTEGDAEHVLPTPAREPMSSEDWMIAYAPLNPPSDPETELWEADEVDALADVTDKQIWSVVEGDEGLYVVPRVPGSQLVNVVGFAVTAVEWDDPTIEAEW